MSGLLSIIIIIINDGYLLCFRSAVPPGHPTQRFAVESTLARAGPCVLRPPGGQDGELFSGLAALAPAQLSARHAAGPVTERADTSARVHHRVRAQRGRRHR